VNAPRPNLSKYVVVDDVSARTDRIWFGVSERLARAPRSRRARFSMLLAWSAALALAFLAGVFFTRARLPTGWAQLETADDAVSIALSDGSRLKLARHTRLEVQDSSERKVSLKLDRGRVDCDVTPDRRRAFAVLAAGFEVIVTGTRFGVDLSPDHGRLQVDVQQGAVNVHHEGQARPEATLHAGQHWSIDLKQPTVSPVAPPPPDDHAPSPRMSSPAAEPDAGPADAAAAASEPRGVARSEAGGAPARNGVTQQQWNAARRLLDQANAARRKGDFAGAARAYDLLLTSYPRDGRAGLAAFELGRLRMDRLGDARGAIVPLQQASERLTDPGLREDAMARLVRALDTLGETSRCLEVRGLYLDAHPTGVHVTSVADACGVRAE
jgi:transmembrane sensor